jgi:hypothetical protein
MLATQGSTGPKSGHSGCHGETNPCRLCLRVEDLDPNLLVDGGWCSPPPTSSTLIDAPRGTSSVVAMVAGRGTANRTHRIGRNHRIFTLRVGEGGIWREDLAICGARERVYGDGSTDLKKIGVSERGEKLCSAARSTSIDKVPSGEGVKRNCLMVWVDGYIVTDFKAWGEIYQERIHLDWIGVTVLKVGCIYMAPPAGDKWCVLMFTDGSVAREFRSSTVCCNLNRCGRDLH